jgi:chromosome segregation ATPase
MRDEVAALNEERATLESQLSTERTQHRAALAEIEQRKAETATRLAAVDAEIAAKSDLFETLGVLRQEHGFLRDLVSELLSRGQQARATLADLQGQTRALEQRKQQLAADLARQQSELEALDRELVEKGEALGGKPGV